MLQETHSSVQSEQTWVSLSGAKCFFSHGDTNSRGVATLIYDANMNVKNMICDPNGRYILLEIEYNDSSFVLINVYGPTKDKSHAQKSFVGELSDLLGKYVGQAIVLGGDLNMYLQPDIDKSGGLKETISDSTLQLQGLLEHLDLIDIWRIRNPNIRKFTWRGNTKGGLVQSRIDYFLTSLSLAENITIVDILPGICSDHSILFMTLNVKGQERRGRGFWKFNASLLKDKEYVTMVKTCISESRTVNNKLEDKGLLWDVIKCNIRGVTQSYAIRKRKLEREHEYKVMKEITQLEELLANGQMSVLEDLTELKSEYDHIQEKKAQGIIIRAKAEWAELGEKNSKLFLQLEQQSQSAKHIKCLITENGMIDNPVQILEEEKRFYSELYTKPTDRTETFADNPFLNNASLPVVSPALACSCDMDITLEECKKALDQMPNNKSPGSDGFTVEFYTFFWEDIKDLVYNSFIYAFSIGVMSIEQRRGVISLIPKKDKDSRLLKNWRPISLLNIDYKILTKVLATRLQEPLKEIISEDQTGYIKGRCIGENIRVIDDLLEYTSIANIQSYMVLLDFEKAFDMVNIDFLLAALNTFCFGPKFRKWIEILYTDITSCVVNNGHASQFFPLTRGIRQGCPISSMLFIIVVELLASYIRNCPSIKGITIDHVTFTISQLADDTTLFLSDESSVLYAIDMIDKFYDSSGLRLNKDKCEVFILGNCGQSNNIPDHIGGLRCTSNSFKALGVHFCKSNSDARQENFIDKLKNIQITLNIWLQRNLSMKGKITVLRSLVIPKLLYLCSNLYVPDEYIKQVQELTFKFLWGYKPPKIKQSTIIANIHQGGLKMPLFSEVVRSAKIMWIKRILDVRESKWKILAYKLMSATEFDLYCKNDIKYIKPKSPFYKQVLEAWYRFHSVSPVNVDEILQEIIWNNKFIVIGNKPFMHKKWYDKGILYIQDVLNADGKLLNVQELQCKYDIKIHFLEYLSVVNAIPKLWLSKVADSNGNIPVHMEDTLSKLKCNILKLSSKNVYLKCIKNIVKQQTAVDHWIEEFPFLHDYDFADIYVLAHRTGDVKLQSFQYKILNRIFPCNHMLSKWGLVNSETCNFCGNIETIEHYFYYCDQSFWMNVTEWFSQAFQVMIPLKVLDVLMGIPHMKTQDELLSIMNFVILHGKWYIYVSKKEQKKPTFVTFRRYIRHVFTIQIEVLTRNDNEPLTLKQWHNALTYV